MYVIYFDIVLRKFYFLKNNCFELKQNSDNIVIHS